MASTWAASEPLRHPWFTTPSLKRKHSDSSDDDGARDLLLDSDQDTAPTFYPTPPPESTGLQDSTTDGELNNERKRRRCDTIERRMARMYIDTRTGEMMPMNDSEIVECDQALRAPQLSSVQSTASNLSYAYTAGSTSPVSQNSILPQYAVEEPASPEFRSDAMFGRSSSQHTNDEPTITEVRMKGAEPAWYEREKDRIVITDLDEAAAEGEEQKDLEDEYKSEAEPHPNASDWADSNADFSISSVLLDHIKRQSNFPYTPKSQRKETDGALVLFKPPPTSFFKGPNADEKVEEGNTPKQESGVQVEEIDADEARQFASFGHFTTGIVSMDQEEGDTGESMDMDVDMEL